MSILDQVLNITGIDLGTGQRGVQPMKEAAKKMKEKDLTRLAEAYGGLEKVPDSLKPIQNITRDSGLLKGGITRLDPRFNLKGVGKDEEIRQLPGSDKYYVSKKNAPAPDSLGSLFGGIADTITGQRTDFDKLGTEMGAKPKLFDINDPSNYLVSQAQQSLVKGGLESAGIDTTGGTTGAIPDAKAQLDFLEENSDRIRKINRDLGRGAAFDEAANYAITEPLRQKFLRDASTFKQRQLLEAEKIKQGMPNAVQNRLLAADAGFATQAGAIAGQQDSATRFAGLGMQRPFGQPTFRVS